MADFSGTLMSGFFALICFGLGLPLALGRVPPNRWYGYRINRYVFEDREIWYEVNSGGGSQIVAAGFGFAAICGASAFSIGSRNVQSAVCLVTAMLTIAGTIATTIWASRLSHRLAADKGLVLRAPQDDLK